MIDDDREWLEGAGGRSRVARPEIVDSWRRCRLSGVNPDDVTVVPGEPCLDSRIARVAIPVLSAMADIMIGANTSLLLSAPDGTMLWRWSEDSRLAALLDRRSAVVGTRWNEDIIGTNGLGTALETTRPIVVNGAEHFSEALHAFTCAGAPIRHPVTRRVAGVLSVTSLVEDASPLMAPTLLKLAREVEEQLYSESTVRERELLHHFLAERRRGRNAVVAVNEDVVIANKAGARLQVDHRALWNQVEAGVRDSANLELDVADGTGPVQWHTIEHAGSVVGLVIVAEPTEPSRPVPRRATTDVDAPRTPRWPQLAGLLREFARGCDRLIVAGETGAGKRTLLNETFGPVEELDCAAAEEIGSETWLGLARSTLVRDRTSGPVMLAHLEALGAPTCRALGRILDAVPRSDGPLAVAATWNPPGGEPEPAVRALLDRFAAEPFEVPPLRKRPDDVMRRLVGQGPGMPVLSAEAAERVRVHPWPGNHRQLEEFRRWLSRQNRPVLDVGDLPPGWSREAARARLTTIQAAEADAIADALRLHDGNKAAAASHLGISRSSLYRKMREYRLR
ncbi:helix-turn-helix domain-containing protein [Amycolatopsis sp. NPDC006131]|uniref:sigma-54-dependent Fis family transcriptional regulator n=1 Tax=Amycolatopsis sp. NPDC006131 TaxID=3156731 RepID=UPI0033B5BD35